MCISKTVGTYSVRLAQSLKIASRWVFPQHASPTITILILSVTFDITPNFGLVDFIESSSLMKYA